MFPLFSEKVEARLIRFNLCFSQDYRPPNRPLAKCGPSVMRVADGAHGDAPTTESRSHSPKNLEREDGL